MLNKIGNSKHTLHIGEKHGFISLTTRQLDFIVGVAEGRPYQARGGTQGSLKKQIIAVTGWSDMSVIAMFCRFAYKHALVGF